MDQINNSKRIGRLTTRLVVPTPKPQAASAPAWNTCNVVGCNKITTRKADMVRHMAENHGDTKVSCPYCPGTYQISNNLQNHIKKVHRYAVSSNKIGRNISTQTVLEGQGEINRVDISRITASYKNYLNPSPSANPIMGRQGTSTLSLRNTDIKSVIQSIQKEQKTLLRSCGFKRVGALEKALAKSRQELALNKATITQPMTPPSTSGTQSSHSHTNLQQKDDQTLLKSIISLHVSDEDSDMDDSAELLNDILSKKSQVDSDLKLSDSDSSIDSFKSMDNNKDTTQDITHNLEQTTNILLGIYPTPNTNEPSSTQDNDEIEFTQPSSEEEWDNLILNMNM